MQTKVANRDEVLSLIQQKYKSGAQIVSFYNSLFDVIIEHQDLMVLHLEDKMVNRGHSVFDTVRYTKGKLLYQLSEHLDRFIISAQLAKIQLPLTKEEMVKKIIDTTAYAIRKAGDFDYQIRYWLSSGLGGFGLVPTEKSIFYCACFKIGFAYTQQMLLGVKEFTIREVPIKPKLLATMKSNNYMLNCLLVMKTKELGGYQGLQVTNEGYLAEVAAANVAFVMKTGEFVVIPFTNSILRGTTLIRVMEHLNGLASKSGLVKAVQERNLKPEDVYENAEEMMIIGYDMCVPILEYDNRKIGNGKRGKVALYIQQFMDEDFGINGVKIPDNLYLNVQPSPKY